MAFRQSKELLMNMSLDDFAKDCFSLEKLLNEDEIKFVLDTSKLNTLNEVSLRTSLENCLQLN